MKVIDQYFEVYDTDIEDIRKFAKRIEWCGRTAYQSEPDGNTEDFLKRKIVDTGHHSVIEHSLMTVSFVTNRGVSHELVRHRVASFTQESTRYCDYTKKKFDGQVVFIRPVWLDDRVLAGQVNMSNPPDMNEWIEAAQEDEAHYNRLRNLGWSPQKARDVLGQFLKTEIKITANYREWRHIFSLRAISAAAHPQARALLIPLYNLCRIEYPALFDLGEPEPIVT